jgi:uncharacterized membrane protein
MSKAQARGRPAPAAPQRSRPAAPARRDWLRWGSLALAVVGAVDSAYLAWVKLTHTEVFCGTSRACDTVNNSIYAEIGGVPIALLGLGAYLVLGALLLFENRSPTVASWGPVAVFGMALTGTLYSAYLTYVELYVIHAICPYCVLSAVCITGLLALAVVRLVRGPADAPGG